MTFKNISKISLLAKFTLISFLITAAIGISLAMVIQQQMEQNELEHAAKDAADHVVTIMNPNLRQSDLSGPLEPEGSAR